MAQNIADLFEHAVDLTPDRVAVVCGERRLTFDELEQRANRLAHYFADQGLGPGAHIGVYSRNSIEALEVMLAAYKLRAVAINVNYRYVAGELRYLFDNADLAALVHERRLSDQVAKALPGNDKLKHVLVVEDGSDGDCGSYGAIEYETALANGSPERGFPERSGDDHYILYTGGTTGMPKGVIWRHKDIWRTLGGGVDFMTGEPLADEWQQSRQRADGGVLVRLPTAPFIHGAAQWASFQSLFSCGTVVVMPEFDAHEVWRLVQYEGVNVMLIVGDAMARPMIEALNDGDYDTSSLLAIASSAALFSPAVKDQYLEALPNVIITDSIGSSETGFSGIGIASKGAANTGGPRVKADSSATVIGEDNKPVRPGSGETGMLARSGHIPVGYYNDPEKTASVFREIDGVRYVLPGDMARIEDDGTITMLGRGTMCVNTGGEKVFPEEVEAVLKAHPDVFDALVVGVSDDQLGQRVGAVVQARPGSTPLLDELVTHTREHIAGYKVPRSLWLVPEIVRSPSGKPDYRWARQHAEGTEPEASQNLGPRGKA